MHQLGNVSSTRLARQPEMEAGSGGVGPLYNLLRGGMTLVIPGQLWSLGLNLVLQGSTIYMALGTQAH